MCEVLAPPHPMSSSVPPLGPRGQSYQTPNQWSHFADQHVSYRRPSPASQTSVPPRGSMLDTSQGSIARWIADHAGLTIARNLPPMTNSNGQPPRSLNCNGSRTGSMEPPPDYGDRPPVGLISFTPQLPARFPVKAAPRSLSPETSRTERKRRSSSEADEQIVSHLQIPASINNSKGSLAEFAAQITCLFWFETSFNLHRVEDAVRSPTIVPLVQEAVPTIGFRKWVTTLLSTTQVSQNVILLALLFIYRLKKLTYNVKGKAGSEYRLLTVALMLGNKFLDDNTYTNKTWADVSGISVGEIHVMEVEFLSNMKYNLFTSEHDWHLWHVTLGRFWDYFDKASKRPLSIDIYTPLTTSSPRVNGHSNYSSPAMQQAPPPLPAPYPINGMLRQHTPSIPSYLAPSLPALPSPLPQASNTDVRPGNRKRSYDEGSFDAQPAKRMAYASSSSAMEHTPTLSFSATTPQTADMYPTPRLPMPNRIMPPATPNSAVWTPSYSAMSMPHSSMAMPRPPPAAYPATYNWQPPATVLGAPAQASTTPSTAHLPSLTSYDLQATPRPPSAENASPTYPLSSPAAHLLQRNSPYKPVRGVNTLLVPPPDASLQNPPRFFNAQNMLYQPLSKRPLEPPRHGPVPYLRQQFLTSGAGGGAGAGEEYAHAARFPPMVDHRQGMEGRAQLPFFDHRQGLRQQSF